MFVKKYKKTICVALFLLFWLTTMCYMAYDLRGGRFSFGGEWLPITMLPAIFVVEWLDS